MSILFSHLMVLKIGRIDRRSIICRKAGKIYAVMVPNRTGYSGS